MKKKTTVKPETEVVSVAALERAHAYIFTETVKRVTRCEVCGSDSAPNSTENLCWVCRRLKISAWRDNDHQMAAQE